MHAHHEVVTEFARQLGVRQRLPAPGGTLLLALDPDGILGLEPAPPGPEPELLLYRGCPVGALPGAAVRHALACSHATRSRHFCPQLGLRRMGDDLHLLALLRLPERQVSLSMLSEATGFLQQRLAETLAWGDGHA